MKIATILTDALSLIFKEENWTTEVYARDKNNEAEDFLSKNVCKFCILGAIYKSLYDRKLSLLNLDPITNIPDRGFSEIIVSSIQEAMPEDEKYTLSYFNDTFPHVEVVKLLQKAIEIAGDKTFGEEII